MSATTCSSYTTDIHQCVAPNCTGWGSVPCGGCSPCDPTGTAAGANGRTCPCKDNTCIKPAGRQIPINSCSKGIAGTKDECRYGHNDYWYMTFDPVGGGPCDVSTTPPCPWLGSVTCAYSLVHVPAGYGTTQCEDVSGSAGINVARLYSCEGIESTSLPIQNCSTPVMYGWPIDCVTPVNPGCECVCECSVGTLGSFELNYTAVGGCAYTQAFATITFAVPCGNTPGIILCGYGCDDCASSYLGLYIQMTSVKKAVGLYGSPNFIEATPPYEPLCESLGISNPPTATNDCDAGSEFDPNLCADKCCECVRGWYVVLRKRRTAADGNLCTMAKGKYEIVGTARCGDGGPYYACNGTGLEGETPCIDGLSACADPGAWANYFSKLGLKLEVEIT